MHNGSAMQGLLEPSSVSRPIPTPQRGRVAFLVHLLWLLPLAWLLYHIHYRFLGINFHEVLPGRVYRSAQTSPEKLEAFVRRYGIRTIVNLRGTCSDQPWYLDQCAVAQGKGLNQEDLNFSAHRLPSSSELNRLIEVLDHAEPPMLLHCRQGADRTGLASVVARILYTEDSFEEALKHLSWRYAHLPIAKTLNMDRFFDLYRVWLRAEGRDHSAETFRHWARHEYRGGWCQQAFEKVEPLQALCRCNEPLGFRVRLKNISSRTWQFRPFESAGVHLGVDVLGPDNRLVQQFRAGLLEKDVGPGETVELIVAVPPLRVAGPYRLRMDMIDEGHGSFQQAGAEAWEEEIMVHE